MRATDLAETARIGLVSDIHGAHGVTRPTFVVGNPRAAVTKCAPPGPNGLLAPQHFFYRVIPVNVSFPAWLSMLLRAAVGLAL